VGDDDGLVAALDRVLDDSALRGRLVAAGSARAATFSWERCGEGLSRLYRDAAGGPGG
jgi:glycosyltransferase involved in cell wall biosynthesis